MVKVKYPNLCDKAKESKILVPIKCHICKGKRLVHMHSHCSKVKLCNVCANRERKEEFEGRG